MIFAVADAHCDYLYGAMQRGYDMYSPKPMQCLTKERLRAGGVALQCFAAWVDTGLRSTPSMQLVQMLDRYHSLLESDSDFVPFTQDYSPSSGKIACLLTIEGGEAIDGSLAALRNAYRLGVRAMTLTWNENNELADCAVGKRQRGLTALGERVICEMARLNMALDTSHLSDRGIDEVLSLSSGAVYASHSNSRAVCNHPRNLKDEHIAAIAKRGGVVGVNFYSPELRESKQADASDVARHMAHIASVGGVECCCVGSDFDGMVRYPPDLSSSADLQRLCLELARKGFSDRDIYRIMYQNLAGFLRSLV